ncbi:MAG: GNAT family N-acetyltransferase [Chloroherpetonaceae bacterium]|nr:GNAT family N-acetyltransferase [Chthonomonadaceae bacterium]MDW8207647.1 GNAT family N-acetyltransferase [Chloroherpetonaceae bacterium]
MSVEFRALQPQEREACLNLWRTVWPDESPDTWQRYFYGDVEWLPYYTQVAVEEGRIVSTAHICKRIVACGTFQLTLGGITGVATRPEYRGRGYSTECLRRAITIMEADAMDFSLLFLHNPGMHDHCAPPGYVTLPLPVLEAALTPEAVPRSTDLLVRQATANDLPQIREIYNRYNHRRPLAVQRNEAYWRDWLRIHPGHLPDTLRVATDAEGKVLGYIRIEKLPGNAEEAGARVIECGWILDLRPEVEQQVVTALLDDVIAQLPPVPQRLLRLEVAMEPALQTALEPVAERTAARWQRSAMVRLLHRDNLLRGLTLDWNERWIAAGRPTGQVAFQTPYGPVLLDASGPFLRVQPIDTEESALGQETFFELLIGLREPATIAPDARCHTLLNTLFPRHACVYWPADQF